MDEDAVHSLGPSELEILVPQATDLSLNDLGPSDRPTGDKELGEHHGTHGLKNLSSIPLRTSLHFGPSRPLLYICIRSLIHSQD